MIILSLLWPLSLSPVFSGSGVRSLVYVVCRIEGFGSRLKRFVSGFFGIYGFRQVLGFVGCQACFLLFRFSCHEFTLGVMGLKFVELRACRAFSSTVDCSRFSDPGSLGTVIFRRSNAARCSTLRQQKQNCNHGAHAPKLPDSGWDLGFYPEAKLNNS